MYIYYVYFVTNTVGYIMSCDYNVKNMIQRTTVQFHYDEKQSMNSKTSTKKQEMFVSGQTIYRGILFIVITFFDLKEFTKRQEQIGLYCTL